MYQMAPMNWLILYMFFIMIFYIFNVKNFYMLMLKPSKKISMIKLLKINWKW